MEEMSREVSEYLMALDAGTGSGRCVLTSVDGSRSVSVAREWGYREEPEAGPMACQFDPDTFWQVLAGVTKDALDRAGIDGRQVAGVTSTSQREGIVLLGTDGRELYAGPNRDMRGEVEGRALAAKWGDLIHQRTGHYPSGMFAPARLHWFRRHQPDLFQRFRRLIMINDWVLYRLSGEIASEPSNASETCLFDLGPLRWAEDLLDELEIPRHLLPQVVPSGTRIGAVTPAASRETGLLVGTPVVTGGADTQCGLVGCGIMDPGGLVVVAGTTAPLQLVTKEPTIDPNRRLWAGVHVAPSRYILESNAGGAGIVYRWLRDAFCEAQRVGVAERDSAPFDLVNELAAEAPPGSWGARSFLGATVMDAHETALPTGALEIGATLWGGNGRAGVARAVLEGLAFAARANADQIAAVSGSRAMTLTACGGLTRSPLYLSILAAVLGNPVTVPRWREASGIGAAICAGIGAGAFSDFKAGTALLVHRDEVIDPDPDLTDVYAGLYSDWLQRYRTLAGPPAAPSTVAAKEN